MSHVRSTGPSLRATGYVRQGTGEDHRLVVGTLHECMQECRERTDVHQHNGGLDVCDTRANRTRGEGEGKQPHRLPGDHGKGGEGGEGRGE